MDLFQKSTRYEFPTGTENSRDESRDSEQYCEEQRGTLVTNLLACSAGRDGRRSRDYFHLDGGGLSGAVTRCGGVEIGGPDEERILWIPEWNEARREEVRVEEKVRERLERKRVEEAV